MFVFAQPARSKRTMLASISEPVIASKLPERNTLDYTLESGERRIRLHETDILFFDPKGKITINTGGYNTKTTRERLNTYLPREFRVFTERGRIHLRTPWQTIKFGETVTIDPKRHKITGDIVTDEKAKKVEKEISAYLAKFKKTGIAKLIENSGGDPWVLPNKFGKIDDYIIKDWIKTKYVHMRLVILALEFAGIRDPALYIRLTRGEWDAMMTRRVRRYVRACLGLES